MGRRCVMCRASVESLTKTPNDLDFSKNAHFKFLMRMRLRTTQPSPFGRKVLIAADLLGLSDRIEIEHAELMVEETLHVQNPLGKVPTLLLEDGRILYDSRVIVEYLDALAGGARLIPDEPVPRFEALRVAALADGILDAAILILYETRFRPDRDPYEPWLDYQRAKIARGIASLTAAPPQIEPVTVAAIGIACALGYLDFRRQYDWRAASPVLIEWLDRFAKAVPAYGRTEPKD